MVNDHMSEPSKADSQRGSLQAMPTSQSPGSSGSGGGRTPTPAIAVLSPTFRHRQPFPPSPLSRMQPGSPGDKSTSPDTTISPISNTQLSPSGNSFPESSPCFIHSHLNKHGSGSLQDWLKNKAVTGATQHHPPHHPQHHLPHHHTHGNTSHQTKPPIHLHNGPTPVRQTPAHNCPPPKGHTPRQAPTSSPSSTPGTSRVTSPTSTGARGDPKDASSSSSYESDPSAATGGSAVLVGDLFDDEEEGGSITKQLAETAQGVREMSKELGRTRVRSRIQYVLIVTKARDNRLINLTRELAIYLMQKKPISSPDNASRSEPNERGMVVYVDAQLRASKRFDAGGIQRDYPQFFQPVSRRRSSSSTSISTLSAYPSSSNMADAVKRRDDGQLRYWTAEMCSSSPQLFDFVVTLGGDGTVLFTSWLFQRIVPPVLPFALGSLGFLTNFDFAKYKETMDKVIDDGIRVNLRMRFTCTVYRAIAPEEANQAFASGKKRKAIKKAGGEILMSQVDRAGWEALEGPNTLNDGQRCGQGKDKEIMCFSTRPVEQFEVLNDLVVDRGPSPFVSLLELFGDEHHLTTVQADGLTVSTPTGSTAYSLSAGGSLVHPQIPALLLTPICPHTLSFRPMLLPDSMELRICVPYNSRSTAWASFDGRGRVELKQGDHIKITASKFPFPTVSADKASIDWFSSISRTLRWNEREKQKSFVVVEEDREPQTQTGKSHSGFTRARHHDTYEDARRKAERVHQKLVEEKPTEDGEIDDEEDEDEDEDEEEDEYDIDDKSGGEVTNPSSPNSKPTNPRHLPQHMTSLHAVHHKSGVDSPDRYVTPYSAPPPLSRRHLVEALAAAEIEDKDGEIGQWDDIRAGPEGLRVDGGAHLIPTGRILSPAEETDSKSMKDIKKPRPETTESDGGRRRTDSKANAFAFYGQDDSASDLSDDPSE